MTGREQAQMDILTSLVLSEHTRLLGICDRRCNEVYFYGRYDAYNRFTEDIVDMLYSLNFEDEDINKFKKFIDELDEEIYERKNNTFK